MIFNECGGNLVRSKREELDEGGVCSDNGVVCGTCIVNYEWELICIVKWVINGNNR